MRRRHTAVETEILGVAARIFSERGYQGTTLDDIAAAANISRSTFYSYFASKEELLHRIYRQVISTTQAAVARMAGEDRPAPEKLRRIIRYLISYLATHTSHAFVLSPPQSRCRDVDLSKRLIVQMATLCALS